MRQSGQKKTYILSLNTIFYNIFTRRSKQGRPASLIHRILQERPYSRHTDLALRPICLYSLLLLIRAHPAWMCSINPRPLVLWTSKARLIILRPSYHGAHEEDLGELGAGVERIWAEVGIYFVDGGKLGGGEGSAVELGGLEDEAGVGG